MTTPELDRNTVERLATALLIPIRNHYLRGPVGADRAYEVLNALAITAGVVLLGAEGAGGKGVRFFLDALRQQLVEATGFCSCAHGVCAKVNGSHYAGRCFGDGSP